MSDSSEVVNEQTKEKKQKKVGKRKRKPKNERQQRNTKNNVLMTVIIPRAKVIQVEQKISWKEALKNASTEYRENKK